MHPDYCLSCGCDLLDELDVTLATMRQFEQDGSKGCCLACQYDQNEVTYWQHEGSSCVWTGSKSGSWDSKDVAVLDPAVDEIFKDTFFQRIADGWSYEL